MATVVNLFSHTLGRKLIMALTGLFLILFLLGHVSGNLLLLSSDPLPFNEYAVFMTTNPAVTVLSYATYISVILHVIYSIILTMHNRKARPDRYVYDKLAGSSSWSSRNMGILGTIILLFLVFHLAGFWYRYRFGAVPVMEGTDIRDLYTVVDTAYEQWWIVLFYVVSMGFLAFHLSHGFQSAFQTLGLEHKTYTPLIKRLGLIFSIAIPTLFAIIPIYMFFT